MIAKTQYTDFTGTVAADISDALGSASGDDLEAIGKYFNLDENRFKIVGLSIYGTEKPYISLICVDKDRSTEEEEYLVKMSCDSEEGNDVLDIIFKRLKVVLHDKYDDKYRHMDYNEEANFSDFHEIEENEEV